MKAFFKKHTLEFKRPAGTSRGVLNSKETYFLYIQSTKGIGIGECNLFKGLSVDDRPDYEVKLQWLCDHIHMQPSAIVQELLEWPSILFGYEMAWQSLQSSDPFELFPSMFTVGQDSIAINGLIWMGDHQFMLQQLEQKLQEGFHCIKIKIGAIDFNDELDLLALIRSRFRESDITIRVDANGAFTPQEALRKLDLLSQYQVHSIEQPIQAGQWDSMASLCRDTPVPIALDEELIGLFTIDQKRNCLDHINPQYIILKPALVGGFQSSREWINEAGLRHINWWITSALESNVGLNAIAQFTYTLGNHMPQGLGTGSLFTNNIESPLEIKNGQLWNNHKESWNTQLLNL